MDITEITEVFRKYLHERGLRFTPERVEVIREIFSSEEHIESEELYLRLKNKKSRVSRATVYRCLSLLESCGLVNKSSFGQRHSHYELAFNRDHHDHLICNKCGKVVEFCDKTIENRQKLICKSNNFALESHRLQIFGICSDCRKDER